MNRYGLIGKKLGHSFSKKFFESKFDREKIEDATYDLFEIASIEDFPDLIVNEPNLRGLNVTIPYKTEIIPYLDRLDGSAAKVGAVNVVSFEKGQLVGYNSDYFGFLNSLQNWCGDTIEKALVLGTGGASKAVLAALLDIGMTTAIVSRYAQQNMLTYEDVNAASFPFEEYQLIVNTTPLGMYPEVNTCPLLPYSRIHPNQYFYDLVYNPEHTEFMQRAVAQGAKAKNGLEMLHLQAEKSWEIWHS